jgi:hypothetical protein
MPYAEIFEAFPEELRLAVARLVDALKADLDVRRTDFEALRGAVQELAAAQARTETRLDRVAAAVEELAQAQKRTETRLEELAAAQARTETRLDRVVAAVEELAQAQKRTQDELTLFRRTFLSQIGGLEARWGLQTEDAFRQGIRTILAEVGFTTERFLTWDATREVFGHPEQVELDVVVQNGRVVIVEIKSALDRANTYLFHRKVAFYTQHTGRQVDRQVVVAPYADEHAKEVARRLGIEVCTDVTELH